MSRTKSYLAYLTTGLLVAAAATPAFAQQTPPMAGDCQQLIAVLQKADASLYDKAKACQALAVVGTKDAVPVLAGLLSHPELAHYARFALEPIPDSAVDDTLRDAAGKLQGKLLVGAIQSIGVREDAKAVGLLVGKLADSDREVAAAAAQSLARIATPEAVAALRQSLAGSPELRKPMGDACLIAADVLLTRGDKAGAVAVYDALRKADVAKYLQLAALTGAIRARGADGLTLMAESLRSDDPQVFEAALHAAQLLGTAEAANVLVAELKLPTSVEGKGQVPGSQYPRQTILIYALGAMGNKVALPAVLKAAESPAWDIRQAAVTALGDLGDGQAVAGLLAVAVDDASGLSAAAQESLANLDAADVDAALVAQFAKSEGKARAVIVDLLGRRAVASAVPTLIQAADDADEAVRDAALRSLARTVGPEQLPLLIDRLVGAKTAQAAAVAEESLRTACVRMPDRDAAAGMLMAGMSKASTEGKVALLDLLGVLGGAKALTGVAEAAQSADDPLKDAATRVLGGWMSVDAAPVLLQLAKSEANERYATRALRGYIRIARQLDMEPQQRFEMSRLAMEAAKRDDERRLAVEVLSRVRSGEALAQVTPYLANPALKESASKTAIMIGDKILQSDPRAVADCMKLVVKATENQDLLKRAQTLLEQAEKKLSGN